MKLTCKNCDSEITDGGVFKESNRVIDEVKVKRVNFALGKNYQALCEKCGDEQIQQASSILRKEEEKIISELESRVSDFPMFTVDVLPHGTKYVLKNMVTANVTVGTFIFNEFSQAINDTLGTATSKTGTALKANKGEEAAKSILIAKAKKMKANIILGVDIDYGTTANNAVTVNMQGTAAYVENISQLIAEEEVDKLAEIENLEERLRSLQALF